MNDRIIIDSAYFGDMSGADIYILYAFVLFSIGAFTVVFSTGYFKDQEPLKGISLAVITVLLFSGVTWCWIKYLEVTYTVEKETVSELKDAGFSSVDLNYPSFYGTLDGRIVECTSLEITEGTYEIMCRNN